MQFRVLKGEFSKSLLRLLIWILLIYESLIVSSRGTIELECELSNCKTSRLLFQFFQLLRKTNEVDCNIFVIWSSRVSLKYKTNISSRCLKTGVGILQQYFGCNSDEHIWTKTKKNNLQEAACLRYLTFPIVDTRITKTGVDNLKILEVMYLAIFSRLVGRVLVG